MSSSELSDAYANFGELLRVLRLRINGYASALADPSANVLPASAPSSFLDIKGYVDADEKRLAAFNQIIKARQDKASSRDQALAGNIESLEVKLSHTQRKEQKLSEDLKMKTEQFNKMSEENAKLRAQVGEYEKAQQEDFERFGAIIRDKETKLKEAISEADSLSESHSIENKNAKDLLADRDRQINELKLQLEKSRAETKTKGDEHRIAQLELKDFQIRSEKEIERLRTQLSQEGVKRKVSDVKDIVSSRFASKVEADRKLVEEKEKAQEEATALSIRLRQAQKETAGVKERLQKAEQDSKQKLEAKDQELESMNIELKTQNIKIRDLQSQLRTSLESIESKKRQLHADNKLEQELLSVQTRLSDTERSRDQLVGRLRDEISSLSAQLSDEKKRAEDARHIVANFEVQDKKSLEEAREGVERKQKELDACLDAISKRDKELASIKLEYKNFAMGRADTLEKENKRLAGVTAQLESELHETEAKHSKLLKDIEAKNEAAISLELKTQAEEKQKRITQLEQEAKEHKEALSAAEERASISDRLRVEADTARKSLADQLFDVELKLTRAQGFIEAQKKGDLLARVGGQLEAKLGIINTFQAKFNRLDERIRGLREVVEERHQELSIARGELNSERSKNEQLSIELGLAKSQLEKLRGSLDAEREKVKAANTRALTAESQTVHLKHEMEVMESEISHRAETMASGSVSQKEKETSRLQEELAALKEQLASAEENMDTMRIQLQASVKRSTDDLEATNSKAAEIEAGLKVEVGLLKNQLEEADIARGQAEASQKSLAKELETAQALSKQQATQLSANATELSGLNAALERVTGERDKLQQAQSTHKNTALSGQAKVESAERALAEANVKIDELKRQIAAIKEGSLKSSTSSDNISRDPPSPLMRPTSIKFATGTSSGSGGSVVPVQSSPNLSTRAISFGGSGTGHTRGPSLGGTLTFGSSALDLAGAPKQSSAPKDAHKRSQTMNASLLGGITIKKEGDDTSTSSTSSSSSSSSSDGPSSTVLSGSVSVDTSTSPSPSPTSITASTSSDSSSTSPFVIASTASP